MSARNARLLGFTNDGPSVDGAETVRRAIADFFFERPDELDIRHLWDRAGCWSFRVNFWGAEAATGGPTIRRSAFVVAEIANGSIRVREVN